MRLTQHHTATLPPVRCVCATCNSPIDRTRQTAHDCPGPPRGARQSSFSTASAESEKPAPPPADPERLTEVDRRDRVPK